MKWIPKNSGIIYSLNTAKLLLSTGNAFNLNLSKIQSPSLTVILKDKTQVKGSLQALKKPLDKGFFIPQVCKYPYKV